MKHGPLPSPQPTRERQTYLAAARLYRDAFRIVFPHPLATRRTFRGRVGRAGFETAAEELAAEHEKADALSPRVPEATRAAAFLYWSNRARRPRRYLVAIAEAIRTEVRAREYMDRESDAGYAYGSARAWLRDATDARSLTLPAGRAFLEEARKVYRQPRCACRAMIRHAREAGAHTTWDVLRARPETFGRLRTGFRWIVVPTTDGARERADGLARLFRDLAGSYPKRRRLADVRRLQAELEAATKELRAVQATPRPRGGDLREAARLVAVLYRRRDVDEQPRRTGRPSIPAQLAALLPRGAERIIREVLHMALTESGEDPPRSREHPTSLEVELGMRRPPEREREWGGLGR
jgi:hypothetical protein